MAVVNGYCTVDDLREHLKDDGERLPLTLLERAIEATSRAIDDHCGRRFWQDAATVALTYRARDPYCLCVADISTRTGLVVETDTTGDGTFSTTWDAADVALEPRNADVVASGSTGPAHSFTRITAIDDKTFPLSERRATVRVTARGGWSAVPVSVEDACILKAARLFKRKDAVQGVLGFSEFGGVVRIGRNDPDVAELLQGFVRFTSPDV